MLTVTAVRSSVSSNFRFMNNRLKPVLTSPNWSLCPHIMCTDTPNLELSNDPKIIFFGPILGELQLNEGRVTYNVTPVTM